MWKLNHNVLASVVICFFISLAPFHTQRLLYVLQDYRLINELQILKKRIYGKVSSFSSGWIGCLMKFTTPLMRNFFTLRGYFSISMPQLTRSSTTLCRLSTGRPSSPPSFTGTSRCPDIATCRGGQWGPWCRGLGRRARAPGRPGPQSGWTMTLNCR